jgi:hypothetical protein
MQSSSIAVSTKLAGPDLLPSRPRPVQERNPRIKPSLEFRRIALRATDFRTFRVF